MLWVLAEALPMSTHNIYLDLSSTSHQGVARTKARMKMFYLYGMGVEVVAGCVASWGISGGSSHGRVPYRFEHFLMMVDQYTKWVECVALPSQTVEVTANAAVDNFEVLMSIPNILRPRLQVSKLCAALREALQIHKSGISPYWPSWL